MGRCHWVQGEALGRSRPKGTASLTPPYKCGQSLLIRLVPKGQQLREQTEKAKVPCQEPLASQRTLPVLLLATDKGLPGQDRWPHAPLTSNPHPNQGEQEDRKRSDAL